MALTAFVSAAILAMLAWLEAPSWWRGVLFGACVGLAVLSKFSALVFLPAAAAVMLVAYVVAARPGLAYLAGHGRRLGLTLGLAIVVACLAVWAGYRFSIGKVRFANLRLPAPELYLGIETVADHNAKGHPSYLLGERSDSGFWYYYPVVLAVKTPLPFLILLAIGAFLCVKQPRAVPCRMPVSFSVGILAVALFSNINIGVRHVLAAYVGFSIMGAIAVSEWLGRLRRSKWRAWTLGVLLAWMTGSSALAHPDYLAYFNELVGAQPEKVLADSDLDWGQDMKRLGKRLQQLGAREVTFNRFIVAHNEELLGFPPVRPGSPVEPSPGWNAVSTTVWKVARLGLYNEHPEVRLWPDVWKPTERVGKGTLLYYVPSALFTKPTR
jgi:4-amino-4-deoxy-L-arabinose transferase-like glycosyltransferase